MTKRAIYDNLLRWRLTLLQEEQSAITSLDQPSDHDLDIERLSELLELCEVIIADGEVSLEEVKGLLRWLCDNRNSELPQVRLLIQIMERITRDKVITPAEKQELKAGIERVLRSQS